MATPEQRIAHDNEADHFLSEQTDSTDKNGWLQQKDPQPMDINKGAAGSGKPTAQDANSEVATSTEIVASHRCNVNVGKVVDLEGATPLRKDIQDMLNGIAPSSDTHNYPAPYGELRTEMVRAFEQGGKDGARKVFARYASADLRIASLRCADPIVERSVWSVANLLDAEFPEPCWAVPDLIPVGLVLLAGRPKMGKSWLCLQVSLAVGTGGQTLGRVVAHGRVLYLALEDYPRRIQKRLRKQQAQRNCNVHFKFAWESLAKPEGLEHLKREVEEHGYTMVIIDTISRALGATDQMDQGAMNVCMGQLQQLASQHNITLLVVDHHRKSAGYVGDVIDDVMGATSKASVADAALGIYRQRGESSATLKLSGRDIDDAELALSFDTATCTWQYLGDAADVKAQTFQAEILAAMKDKGGKATTAELAAYLQKHASQVSRELQELIGKGRVKKGERAGRDVPYYLVDQEVHLTTDRSHMM